VDLTRHHIPFDRLADLVEDRLPPADRAQVLAHVTACSRCVADVSWLERTIGLMRTDAAEEPPSYVIDRAVQLFRSRRAAASPLRHLLAALRFDSGQMQPALGVRAAAAASRQLLFSADVYDLDLRVVATGELWAVSGQVLGPGEGGHVELRGRTGTIETAMSVVREFVLPPVPAGAYTLILHLPEVVVEIPELPVGG
jgi:anti-sigma factor RsiW